MSESVLHKNHSPPFLILELLPFVVFSYLNFVWNISQCNGVAWAFLMLRSVKESVDRRANFEGAILG